MHTCAHPRCICARARRNVRAHFYASCAHMCAWIFTNFFLVYLYHLMNLSIKFHKYRSYGSGDISKTILTFVQSLIFYVFCIFSKFEHQSSTNLENCKLGIWSFGNLISKCNRLSEHIKHIIAIEVLYKLRNKQKDYVISRETPCSFREWQVCVVVIK